ncbi:hypothetical protein POM88_016962 [Heracleum sosnowskyi]|uniref:Uncharacterized protein n=1 Tax=Heracleum sosnowskyi TaxID=360622 RepID=A0AAD8IPM1_9APIA|nr:hypothetical protein POM88_016962 [Heracleum sosnowskyi]
MSETKFNELCNLEPNRFDWKIKVRIIRLWRGVSKKGEIFKGFNIILLDNRNNRMHAFVPANSADKLEPNITIGKVCVIRKFTVQEYKIEDKFRCLRNNAQLIFSNETQIKDIEDDGKSIEHNAFDFYDHSELMELTKQTTYLVDVVGIIKFYQPLADLVNKRGNPQKQVKFTITNGRSSVNVTFWDAFAEKFQEQMNQVSEKPVIVIIANSRVGLWNDQVDISSFGEPVFSQQIYVVDKNRELELLKVEAIKRLGKDYIMREVCTHVTIKSIEETQKWYSTVCTDCEQEIELEAYKWFCLNCNRILPYPDKKFHITAVASDKTSTFQLSLGDQPTRAVLQKRAVQLLK